MFKFIDGTPIRVTLAERSKVNLDLDLWNLFYSHCIIRLNISSDYNDFGFNCFQKSSFQKKIPFKCTLSRSWSSEDYHLNKLGRPHIPNATY